MDDLLEQIALAALAVKAARKESLVAGEAAQRAVATQKNAEDEFRELVQCKGSSDVAYQLALKLCGLLAINDDVLRVGDDVSVSRTGRQLWALANHRTGVGNTGKSESEAARILVQMLGAKLPAEPEYASLEFCRRQLMCIMIRTDRSFPSRQGNACEATRVDRDSWIVTRGLQSALDHGREFNNVDAAAAELHRLLND